MSLHELNYRKSWNNASDFPTYQSSEAQVRADLQYFPDAIRSYINDDLLPAIEDALQEVSLGAVADGSLTAAKLDADLYRCIRALESDLTLAAEDWSSDQTYLISDALLRAGLREGCSAAEDDYIVTAGADIHLTLAPEADAEAAAAFARARITLSDQSDGALVLKCLSIKPSVALPIILTIREDV